MQCSLGSQTVLCSAQGVQQGDLTSLSHPHPIHLSDPIPLGTGGRLVIANLDNDLRTSQVWQDSEIHQDQPERGHKITVLSPLSSQWQWCVLPLSPWGPAEL